MGFKNRVIYLDESGRMKYFGKDDVKGKRQN